MSGGVIVWLVLFGVSTLLFFGIAAVVAVRGLGELRDLLRRVPAAKQEVDQR
ncbi:MAG: hypothetical protein AB1428_02885 [Bacteroidota bacterium]